MWNRVKKKQGIDIVITISGVIVFIISAVAAVGWITGMHVLASIDSKYIPMAPSSALFFIVIGLMMIFNFFEYDKRKIGPYFITIVFLISIYGLLKFLEPFIHYDLTLEQYIFTGGEKLGNFPLFKMSHYAGLLFFISGIAVIMKYFGKEQKIVVNLIGSLGLLIAFAGFVASLGYAFRTPFLYSGTIIPLSAPSAIAFLFLGFGLLALSGENNYFVSKLNGTQASARILRAFLPLLIVENVTGDLLELYIPRYYNVNYALISALVTLTFIIIAIILTLYLTKIIFQSANKAEAERVEAEVALKESLAFRNTLLRTIPFGMDIIDENGTILFQNEVLRNKLGRDVIGAKCWEIYRDGKTQCNDCPIKSGIKIGETRINELHDILGGEIFEVNHTGLMFNGKKAILEIFHDITERKQSELRLKEYAGELELANKTKDKLFSIVAHDLRSPFNSILGLTQLLNDEFDSISNDEKQSTILKLKEASENAFDLLENLLVWSLAQRDGITANPEKIDLYEIASMKMEVFAAVSHVKNIRIVNLIMPGTFANADKNMVTTILRNLLNNALKFTRSGGSITITSFAENDKIIVSVTDTGVGISENILENMFKSSETHTTRGTANEKGTGLGLMICKEFTELNGGAIWVESEVGKGSRFSFTLPAIVNIKISKAM
jgi:PAS domain S-box-containing protein